jgi:hypothetical protein
VPALGGGFGVHSFFAGFCVSHVTKTPEFLSLRVYSTLYYATHSGDLLGLVDLLNEILGLTFRLQSDSHILLVNSLSNKPFFYTSLINSVCEPSACKRVKDVLSAYYRLVQFGSIIAENMP